MEKKLLVGVSSLVSLQFFSAFGEYFFSVSSLYALLVVILITYNIYGLILQRALSESLAFTSLMTGYLIFNDDLLLLNFLNFNHSIVNDYFAFFTRILICIFSAFYFWMVASCLKEQKIISFEYPLVIFFAILGLLLMCNGNDFLITYLAIELSTLSFYILASFQKMSNSSIDTAVKYFVIGAVSSAFFLLGSSFLYGFTGSIDFSQFSGLLGEKYDWTYINFYVGVEFMYKNSFEVSIVSLKKGVGNIVLFDETVEVLLASPYFSNKEFFIEQLKEIFFSKLIINYSLVTNFKGMFHNFVQEYCFYLKEDNNSIVKLLDYSLIEFGLTLILFSLFIKLALAPFHTWLLDVYEGVPISSAFFFAVLTKLSLFVLLIRLCYSSFIFLKSCWEFYSLGVGLLSVFVGSFGGLKEKRLKTLLAYSSVSHMGYALIALSSGTSIGIQMLIFYVLVYMVSGLSIWYVITLLVLKKPKIENKFSKELSDLTLLKKSNVTLSICLALSIFSVAGIPPLVGFFAKLNVFLAVVGGFFYVIGLSSILCSVVSTFYYIRIIKVLYFENLLVGKLYYPIKTVKTVFLGILTFLLLFFFLNPTLLYLVDYKAVLCLLDVKEFM